MIKELFIIGTAHSLQVRPRPPYENDSDQLCSFCQNYLDGQKVLLIAEEMSEDGMKTLEGINTVGREIANERSLSYLMCDPTFKERHILGIGDELTSENFDKRERCWLDKIISANLFPTLFICGASHVSRFKKLCEANDLNVSVIIDDFVGCGRLIGEDGRPNEHRLL